MTTNGMAAGPGRPPHPVAKPAYVAIRQVGKSYGSLKGAVHALEGIELDIRESEFISILGPSGCGKSTLLKCIAGLEKPTSGQIQIQGKPLNGPPDRLGMVFQRDVLLDWRTVLDNVLITAEFAHIPTASMSDRALQLLWRFGLKGYEDPAGCGSAPRSAALCCATPNFC